MPLLLLATAATILALFAEVELVGDAEPGILVVEDRIAVVGLVWRGIGGGCGIGGESVGGGSGEGVLHRPIALLIVLAPVVVLQKGRGSQGCRTFELYEVTIFTFLQSVSISEFLVKSMHSLPSFYTK